MVAGHNQVGVFRAGSKPPCADLRHVKASQAFPSSLSKEGSAGPVCHSWESPRLSQSE